MTDATLPLHRIQPLRDGAARWTEGFWADRFRLCSETIVWSMREALTRPDNSASLTNFEVAAGRVEGEHRGTFWSDGDCYKWLQALAHLYAVTGDLALDQELDHWIELIAASQAPDGYLCTQVQLVPGRQPWTVRRYHELYNMGHLMTAAAVHHRATGKSTFLAVACKLADHLDQVFTPRPPKLQAFGWNPSNIMGLVDLYRVTGERRYLTLADLFVTMRGTVKWGSAEWAALVGDDPNPGDQNQNRVPLREESKAVGHAVTATYLYAGAADVVAETGEQELLAALDRVWAEVAGSKVYLTGAVGAYHHGISERFDPVHEAFGRPYELPNKSAYNETCANLGNAMWNARMRDLTGEARFGDMAEQVLYNSGLSGMSLDGQRFCYANPLARHREIHPMFRHDTLGRWVTHTCYCCPPQVARTLAGLHEWAYGVTDRALWVHLYGGSEVDCDVPGAGRLRLRQTADYPWQPTITLTVDEAPATPLTIALRIPGWANGASLRAGCESIAVEPGSYAEIEAVWQPGDVIELVLPVTPRLVQANPQLEETIGQVAVVFGPLVYCLEECDLPAGVEIESVALPVDARLTARWRPELLGGVMTVVAEARCRPVADPAGPLYSAVEPTADQPLTVELVPYYAWQNREQGQMRVWLPRS